MSIGVNPEVIDDIVSIEHGRSPDGIRQFIGAQAICLVAGETRTMKLSYARELSDMIGVYVRHHAQIIASQTDKA